jgi:thioredoxin 1
MAENVKAISSAEQFEEVTGSGTVLVDFFATWCGPCRQLAPILETVAEKQNGKITIAKVNVDELADVAGKYGIDSIPTLIFFKDGEMVSRSAGLMSEEQLNSEIDRLAS